MKYMKKAVALILISIIAINMVPQFRQTAFAAALPVNIYVDSLSGGTATLRWDLIAGAQSATISYHTPSGPTLVETTLNQATNTAAISGFSDDYIYDIMVRIYDAPGGISGGGNVIGQGLLYFLPRISFYASRGETQREAIPGGGYELGGKPRLNLKWAMPKVWDGSNFVYTNDPAVLTVMQNNINTVYQDGREISALDFRINLSTSLSNLNSGSSQSSLLISYGSPEYTAKVSGFDAVTAKVRPVDANGFMSFDVLGKRDANSDLPPAETYGLPDSDILPGSVYYMNIKPVFKNTGGQNVSVVSVGPVSAQNGSMLLGTSPYTYTPIRFALSKDDMNNIYVKVYRINQGSLDLPGMYYEVQSSDDPSIPGDWTVKKTMTDSFFPNDTPYAVTVLTGINPNNEIYYKIVVKTDSSSDRIESLKMPYTIVEDISKPPVPTGQAVVDMDLVSGQGLNPATGEYENEISSDVTISWNKPANWDQIKANRSPYTEDNDVYFHFLLNTHQSNLSISPHPMLEANGKEYGNFPVKYRLVKYVSALSPNIRENGSHLEYTIKGFDLFKGEGVDGISNEALPNAEGYPSFLLANKVYYLQMYTTNGANKGTTNTENTSNKSITISFTTLSGGERDVPLPKDLRLSQNEVEILTTPSLSISNFVELEFDKVWIDWRHYTSNLSVSKAVYYDLYMSNSTETLSFTRIGTTQNEDGDVAFIGTEPQSETISTTIRDFSPATDAYTVFGKKLRPNTTYYFMVKTRLAIEGLDDKESAFTSILPVTTVSGDINPPDESKRKPLAPTDFSIAEDLRGDPILSGSFVTFQWTRKENDVHYNIICTTERLAPEAAESTYENDPLYQSFLSTFGELALDPDANPLEEKFEYTAASKECKYSIDEWLFPNKLYYFSIRAVNKSNGNSSSWISIPVTTLLIDAPERLEAIQNAELGFFWVDSTPNMKPEDFKVSIKGPKDKDFKVLSRAEAIVVKDADTYFGRILNLEPNAQYDIRVHKGNTNLVLVHEQIGLSTRDSFHEVEVKWKGLPSYRYELSIKTADADEYTSLLHVDLQEYENSDGKRHPYYIEETAETAGSSYSFYYAKIKSSYVTLPGGNGMVERQLLKPNTKYYIKVRAVKIDPLDTTLVSYSKYIGPVDIRTEFNQDDYDEIDRDVKKKATFEDKISKFEEKPYWRVDVGDQDYNKILLKEDKVINILQNSGRYPFTLDISWYAKNIPADVVYIPIDIMKLLNTQNQSMTLKTDGAEYTFRPRTLEIENIDAIDTLWNNTSVKDIFLKITILRSSNTPPGLPSNATLASKNNEFKVQAFGSSEDYKQVKNQVHQKLYHEETGLLQEKLNILMTNATLGTGGTNEIETYVDELVGQVENELSYYIRDMVEGRGSAPGMLVNNTKLEKFHAPLLTKLYYGQQQGVKQPYVELDGIPTVSHALSENIFYFQNTLTFPTQKTGKYMVISLYTPSNDVDENHWAQNEIQILTSKFNLTEVFGNHTSLYPNTNITVKETILLYEKVLGKTGENIGLGLREKVQRLGLLDTIDVVHPVRDISRQETAAIVMKAYALKTAVNLESLVPRRNLYIKDEPSINPKYYKSCVLSLDVGILTLNGKGFFLPDAPMTRAEIMVAFVRMLKLTGDL